MMSGVGSFDLVALAFASFNLLRIGSYLPQIVAVARDRHGASAISFSCWTIWTGANLSTAIYVWDRSGDLGLVLVNGFNAACCLIVLILAAHKQRTHAVRIRALA
jgi:hypothetical protein